MLNLYRLLINLVLLISPLIIILRLIKKKEHPIRFKEKFCFFPIKRGNGKLVWFHGSSVGEILSIIPLVEKLEKNKSIKKILITSSTLSSSKVLTKFKLKKTVHQFFPIDANFLTKKFLDYWNPAIAIFVESEIWPNMLINVKKKSIPLVLLNARITKESYKKWKMISLLSKFLFESFDISFPQNYETKKYLNSLGVKKIKFLGNLKFSESKTQKNIALNKNIEKIFKSRKIWCAASTHNGEEKICIEAHQKLKKKYKKLLTVIIPRHVHRVNNIYKEANKMGFKVQIHSKKSKIKKDTDIYLVDTYGETKSFFKICNTVFLGGSIVNHGGQNPLEPARFGCKILHGPNIQNFTEVYRLLNKENLSFKFYNTNQLAKSVDQSLSKNMNFSKKIAKLKKIGSNILHHTSTEINYFL
jgi:3-deoxy-D-manno-octulosonic-acid transferase